MLGDSLVVCESRSQLMRRLLLETPGLNSVKAHDVIGRDCVAVATNQQGLIYYSTAYDIRRLLPPAKSPSPSAQ